MSQMRFLVPIVAAICGLTLFTSCTSTQTEVAVHPTSVDGQQSTTPTPTYGIALTPTAEASSSVAPPFSQEKCASSKVFYLRVLYDSSSLFLACIADSQVLFTQQVFDGPVSLYEVAASLRGSLVVRDADSDVTYVQQYPRGNREVVFSAMDNVRGFSWSPDGEYISYARWGNEGIAVETLHVESHTISQVFIAKVGDITNLLPTATAWSPDGNKIATLAVGADGTFYHVLNIRCDSITYSCVAEQVREIPIVEPFIGGKPSWMTDSEHLLLICGEQQVELCVFDLNGRVTRRYDLSSLGFTVIRQTALSPDGNFVALSGGHPPNDGIFVVQLDNLSFFEVAAENSADEVGPIWGYPSP